ncbi:MAG: DivIVA domain-containing protein [Ruminococcaceae bacterium]|nr:DivIVA domain-containing protein [Oscillospiraceae bacterium]
MFMPLEVEEKTFSKQMRGYNKEEVDTFVKGVAKDYATLYKENLALKDKTATLSDAVKQYKAMEDTLQQAIIVAQSAGEEVKKNAYAKAENIIKDAENRASEIVNEAGKEVTKVNYEYEEMRRSVEIFRTRIISLLNSQLSIVKEFAMADPGIKKASEQQNNQAPLVSYEENAVVEEKDEMSDIIKTLERVTMELPKLVLNENGEYVAAE